MNKKLIFFDIDGTLLDHQKRLPKSTKQAIEKLQQQGHIIAIATGRSPFTFRWLLEKLSIDTYISLNGQYIVSNGQILYKNPISTSLLKDLYLFAVNKGHPLVYITENDWYSSKYRNVTVETATATLKSRLPTYHPCFYRESEIYQSMVFCNDGEEIVYNDQFKQLDFIRWHANSVDVVPAGVSKAIGIKKLMEFYKISKEDVYAFGDGLNDIQMLKVVSNSVAMGNSPTIVKNAAKYETKDVQEQGIWYGLRKLGLINE